jgi:hypothetical protein
VYHPTDTKEEPHEVKADLKTTVSGNAVKKATSCQIVSKLHFCQDGSKLRCFLKIQFVPRDPFFGYLLSNGSHRLPSVDRGETNTEVLFCSFFESISDIFGDPWLAVLLPDQIFV